MRIATLSATALVGCLGGFPDTTNSGQDGAVEASGLDGAGSSDVLVGDAAVDTTVGADGSDAESSASLAGGDGSQTGPTLDASDGCATNACGGCGALTASPGSACGTCGTYACGSDHSSVNCNDPGATNSCPTWCTQHPAPSGVAASDYQCVDFDNGLPSGSVWASSISGGGSLARSTARASSAPASLFTAVTVSSGSDTATLTWNDVGSAAISSVSASMAVNPGAPVGIVSSESMKLLCISTGLNDACLEYAEGDTSGGTPAYNGLELSWFYNGAAAMTAFCRLGVDLSTNLWNSVKLGVTLGTGAISVMVNGTSPACPCCSAAFSSDTVAKITLGPGSSTLAWTGYIDNVQATIAR